jgi:hypothetical protein
MADGYQIETSADRLLLEDGSLLLLEAQPGGVIPFRMLLGVGLCLLMLFWW